MLLKYIYGLKDSGITYFDFFKDGLRNRGCEKSTIYTLLFTKYVILIIVYVQDAILLLPSKANIQYEINSLQEIFDLTDDGELKEYLETRSENNKKYGSITLTQLQMVEMILELVGLNSNS